MGLKLDTMTENSRYYIAQKTNEYFVLVRDLANENYLNIIYSLQSLKFFYLELFN